MSVGAGQGQPPPSSTVQAATSSPQGQSRLSMPGLSVAVPQGWQVLHLPASQHSVAAVPNLTPPCPQTLFGGQAACQDALSVTSVPGADPARALKRAAVIRFSAMHSDIVTVSELRHGATTAGGCPAFLAAWHVTWIKPPSTIEERIVVKTGSGLESVFIRFAGTPRSQPQASIGGIVSSIRCTP